MSKKELEQIIEEFKTQTATPTIELTPVRGGTTVFESKLGGKPYLPPGFEYPCHSGKDSQHMPLGLLAQLNFSELPTLPGFPEKGILQFYLSHEESDDLYGLNFDDQLEQEGFRIVYHADIIDDVSQLQEQPELMTGDDVYFPFEGEFKLEAKEIEAGKSVSDYQFESKFMEIYRKYIPTEAESIFDLDDEEGEYIYESLEGMGHRIGGSPYFTQTDPREYDDFKDYTVMLLQIDSDFDGDDEIMWGDCGVANFFIRPEDLKKRDFSKVLYNWDCC